MYNWKSKKNKKPSSSTPGKLKGENCQSDWLKKYYFTSPKAHRTNNYKYYVNLAYQLNYKTA